MKRWVGKLTVAVMLLSLWSLTPTVKALATDVPKTQEPKKEEPKKEEPKKETPKKEEPKKEEPRREPPKQEKRCHRERCGSHKECFDGNSVSCVDVPDWCTVCE